MAKAAYIFSDELIRQCNKIPVLRQRVSVTDSIRRQLRRLKERDRLDLHSSETKFNHHSNYLQASIVHELIASYKLTDSLDVVTAVPATEDELRLFHCTYYLDYFRDHCNDESRIKYSDAAASDNVIDTDSDDSNVDDEQLEFGLGKWT